MRRVNGVGGAGGGVGDDTLDVINAAATAIAASEENRAPPSAVIHKRRWTSCWSLYWCFGSYKNNKRIGHAVLAPEPSTSQGNPPASENQVQTQSIVLPFIAPPSSPASFLQSEPPSVAQSPSGILSFQSISSGLYSPGGTASMFAIGPYAHETQLVTPPAFSTYTTEPSTAPFTPPPESVHMTTPSSPEVPFARLLDLVHQNSQDGLTFPYPQYEFQAYHLQPGSPVSHLISPCSGISGSGTSSPFPDGELVFSQPFLLELRNSDPPKLMNLEKIAPHEWASSRGSRQGSGSITPESAAPRHLNGFLPNHTKSNVAVHPHALNLLRSEEAAADHRVSFEVTAGDTIRCVEKKPTVLSKAVLASLGNPDSNVRKQDTQECCSGETSRNASGRASMDGEGPQWYQKQRSITLGSSKEFNFDSVEGANADKHVVGSDWWANEKVVGEKDGEASKNWSFFPVMQPGVS